MPGRAYRSPVRNDSDIGHNLLKWNQVPEGVTLVGHSAKSVIGPSGTRSEASIDFNVPSGQWVLFERWALGFAVPDPGAGVNAPPFLHREVPIQHPLKPWLYAVSVEILEGFGALAPDLNAVAQDGAGNPIAVDGAGNPLPQPDGQNRRRILEMVRYEDSSNGSDGYVRARVHFTDLPFEVREDTEVAQIPNTAGEMERWVERRRELNVQGLPLPAGELKFWDDTLLRAQLAGAAPLLLGSAIPQQDATLIIAIWDIFLIWYAVPDLNFAAWERCAGRLNSDPFDTARGAGPPHPPGTLLCHAPKYRESRTRGVTGRPQFDVTFHFQKRIGLGGPPPGDPKVPLTWNHFPAIDGGWYTAQSNPPAPPFPPGFVVQLDRTQTLYKYADARQLFTLPAPPTKFQ